MRNGNHSEECNVEDEYDIRERNYRSWNSMQSLKKTDTLKHFLLTRNETLFKAIK